MLLDNYRIAEQVQQYCYLAPGVIYVWIRPSTASLVSLEQISLSSGGKRIALRMIVKKRLLPVGL